MNSFKIFEIFLILGYLILGTEGQAVCYDSNYEHFRICDYGCCGTEPTPECCLPTRLIAFSAIGGILFLFLFAATAVLCYFRYKKYQRILNPLNRLTLTNDRSLATQNMATVSTTEGQTWPHFPHPISPPPYEGPPPSYEDISKQVSDARNTSTNGECKPHRSASSSYTEQGQTTHISIQEAPPAYGV